MADLELPTVKCVRCGYEWHPRVVDPKVCPGCGSTRWNDPRPSNYGRPRTRRRFPGMTRL